MIRCLLPLALLLIVTLTALVWRPGFKITDSERNRLPVSGRFDHLDDFEDPYWPTIKSPKLTTPQWIGDPGVEAAAVLSIDDMRDPKPYQNYLAPILDRLEAIDGRAPVTIFTNTVDPKHPQLQKWLDRGLSIEVHTIDHPCPLLQGGDLAKARSTVHRCTDLLNEIPNTAPVCYRMPCCDSMNSVSPRYYRDISLHLTENGHSLTSDSSVFQVFTAVDPELPREIFAGPDGEDVFKKYLPLGKDYVNYLENYPYPYVIGNHCWQFPCTVPSDWEAQFLHGKNNPKTVEDLKRALDATVAKQGLFVFVFHPHGWIENSQVVELIDHATAKHGDKLKFLNMREVQERIDRHLLDGQSIQKADGSDSGTRVLDVNDDGFMDVMFTRGEKLVTRVWQPESGDWRVYESENVDLTASQFAQLPGPGRAALAARDKLWRFDETSGWTQSGTVPRGDRLFRDIDGDGYDEMLFSNSSTVFRYLSNEWVSAGGIAASLVPFECRVIDLNGDGTREIISSTKDFCAIYYWNNWNGWGVIQSNTRGTFPERYEPPLFDAGVWTHKNSFIIQNEDTASEPNVIKRISFDDLLNPKKEAEQKEGLLDSKPLELKEVLQSMTVRPGLDIQLAVAEPLVMDPIDIAWGPDGRLWVVEMADYPLGVDGKDTPGGRVRYLEDTDGDGRYDRSTVFMKDLPYPTGVMAWKKGVLVVAAPDLIFAEDRNGDGEADHREVLYTGFGEGNQQHRVNGLRWGLDGWVHLANGDSGGSIRSVKTGRTVNLGSYDLRIKPDEGLLELTTGRSQHGRNRDDAGHWFGNSNSNPIWHVALEERYLRRNPYFSPGSATVSMPEVPGNAPVFPTSITHERFNDFHTANCITSACATIIHRDDRLGAEFYGNAFVCEPVHNLVHRQVIEPNNATFRSKRADDERTSEFLTSSDTWFRPVAVHAGPDGAMWVVDMYRHVIEHPEWIPHDWETKLDLRAGHERGRLYQVIRKGASLEKMPDLTAMSADDLVKLLEHPNGPLRDLAQQQLVWRKATESAVTLGEMAATHARWQTRVQALGTLECLGKLTRPVVTRALEDPHPAIRRFALRVAPKVGNDWSLNVDQDPLSNIQLAYTLGDLPNQGAKLASLEISNGHLRSAVMSSVLGDLEGFVGAYDLSKQRSLFEPLVSTIVGVSRYDLLESLCKMLSSEPSSYDLASQIFQRELPAEVRTRMIEQLGTVSEAAINVLQASESEDNDRVRAIRFLGSAGVLESADSLEPLLGVSQPVVIQEEAVNLMARRFPNRFASFVHARWAALSPRLLSAITNHLSSNPMLAALLLERHDREEPAPLWAGVMHRHSDESIRHRARELFGQGSTGTSEEQLAKFHEAIAQKQGDRDQGNTLFKTHCAVCHVVGDEGNPVGPDLAALANPSPEFLLTAIADPNQALEDKYAAYTVETKDGQAAVGLLESEAGGAIRMRLANGQPYEVLRTNVSRLTSTGRSLMPEGFADALTPTEMADLIAYVQGIRTPRKAFRFNEPALVESTENGTLSLKATQASIHGPSLSFERRYLNIGQWTHVQDQAVWEMNVEKPGVYNVALDFACADSSAGNTLVVSAGSASLSIKVPGTTNWNGFREQTFGEITLEEGKQELVARSKGTIRRFLIDLREVRLTYLRASSN